MKRKNSKNPKFCVVMFYGPVAAGKYTIAKEFHKQTGFKFFHNHHTADITIELFGRGNVHSAGLTETLRFEVFKAIARAKINVVATHTYAANYVSRTGVSDPLFMKKLQSIIEKAGGIFYCVHLLPSRTELLKRVKGSSRKGFHKVTDIKIQKELLDNNDFVTPAPVHHNIEIDNTGLSPKQVVKKVLGSIS